MAYSVLVSVAMFIFCSLALTAAVCIVLLLARRNRQQAGSDKLHPPRTTAASFPVSHPAQQPASEATPHLHKYSGTSVSAAALPAHPRRA